MNNTVPVALSRFQDAFEYALLAPDSTPDAEVAALTSQPAFAVYRNTVMKGCVDALQANYPAVTRLVGEKWFRAAASVYVRQSPPTDPVLMNYGAGFANFLVGFEAAAELPYLPDVARLDRYWTEAHAASDDKMLDPVTVSGLVPEALASAVLRLHAAARWAWFPEAPIYSIWSRNRSDGLSSGDLDWKSEGALFVRPRDTVQWIALDSGGYAFLDACAHGLTLSNAADAALKAQVDTDLAHLMSVFLTTGVFSELRFQ